MTWQVDVRAVAGRSGASRELRAERPIASLESGLARVPEDHAVKADLRLRGVEGGVVVSGELTGVMVERCARCLRPIRAPFDLPVRELCVAGAAGAEADYSFDPRDGLLDLEPLFRDAILTSIPFAPLCRPDCRGLCPVCGNDLNTGGCACPAETVDPRWAPLGGLRLDDP